MKRSTKRKLNVLVLYAVLLAIVVAVASVADWDAIRLNFFSGEVARELFPEIVTTAAKNTVVFTFIAFIGGLALAFVLAFMRLSPVAPYRWLATVYVEFFRGLPALLVIVAMGFAVPIAFQWRPPGGPVGAGLIALVMVSAAYMAETLRAGIEAVPKGQMEAARSLGMSGSRTTITIVMPQALRIVIPPLTNEFVLLIKDTSLLAFIGVAAADRELTTFARDFQSSTANATPLVLAAAMYLIITLPLTQLVAWLERRQRRAR